MRLGLPRGVEVNPHLLCKAPGDRPSEERGSQPPCGSAGRVSSGVCGSVVNQVITPGVTVLPWGGKAPLRGLFWAGAHRGTG